MKPTRAAAALAALLTLGAGPAPERVPVPAGTHTLRHGERAVTVALPAYEIDRLEASQAAYEACVRAGACTPVERKGCRYGDETGVAPGEWDVLARADHPVVCVSFAQAEAFCRWRGGRVPSEAEWERAARGEDGRLYPWGEEWRAGACNWGDDGKADGAVLTAPVGSYPEGASPYGALDMVGNAWEWARRAPELDDERVPAGRQVIRGAGFAAAVHAQRATKRAPYDAARGYPNVGVRCAYDAAPALRGER